ncbi:MAG: hypothetical protein QHC89_02595 [Bosea sp. (in: a-proteobacteria)]|nr:hypothetical protein [Bosea sp. (in: a-proteobacteria)]
MSDLAALQQQIDDIRALRARGDKRVQFGDEEVEFQTGRDLALAEQDLERRINALTRPKVTAIRIVSSKGL